MRPVQLRMPLLLAPVLALASLALADPALGRPPGGPPGHHGEMGGRLERLVEQLGLDPTTLASVDEVLDASRVRGRELHRRLRAAHEEMRGLLDAAEPDEEAIYAQVDVITALEAEGQKNRLGTLLRVRALLPPDARERLLELMKSRRGGPHHRGRPAPPGSP